MQRILSQIQSNSKSKKKCLALLIDPDKFHDDAIIKKADELSVDYIFVGGSLITIGNLEETIDKIKGITKIPIIIFPGSATHISSKSDAILLLSLLSGRNAEYLIGQHVQAAPILKKANIEILSTGYILIDGGNITTVAYISNTNPIPASKPDVAVATAMAGEMIGNQLIYLDAGSGANNSINAQMIQAVRANIEVPLIIGGGIRNPETATNSWNAGADVIVVGNAIEKDNNLIQELIQARNKLNA